MKGNVKCFVRTLGAVLAGIIVLSVSAAAFAADLPAVFIPDRLSKYDLSDRPDYIHLKTASTDAKIDLYFSEKPDWGGVLWGSTWEWEDLTINDEGHAVLYREGRINLPGKWARTDDGVICDPETGELIDSATGEPAPDGAHSTGDSEWAFQAGKGNVTVQYKLSGVEVAHVILTTDEDYYETGMEGASTQIIWTPMFNNTPSFWADAFDEALQLAVSGSDPGNFWYVMWDKRESEIDWYVSSIVTTYPEGSPIVRVQTDWRNDKTNSLAGYRIDYAAKAPDAVYRITYAPATDTVLQLGGQFINIPGTTQASENLGPGIALIHCEEDEILEGVYLVGGAVELTTGSGEYKDLWFGDRTGGRATRRALRKLSSFKSPRVK